MATEAQEILDYWFGELNDQGLAAADRHAIWFSSNADVDGDIRRRWRDLLSRAVAGELRDWPESDAGLMALIILLDQFSRNIHRNSSRAFDGDPLALGTAQSAIASGRHLELPTIHRVFLYLPLEHCEDLAIQERSVELFEALVVEKSGATNAHQRKQLEGFAQYARAHRDVIAQFGRFPHRNVVLQRESTAAELAHLKTHGGF